MSTGFSLVVLEGVPPVISCFRVIFIVKYKRSDLFVIRIPPTSTHTWSAEINELTRGLTVDYPFGKTLPYRWLTPPSQQPKILFKVFVLQLPLQQPKILFKVLLL